MKRRKVKQHLHRGRTHVSGHRILEWGKFLSQYNTGGPIVIRNTKQMMHAFGEPNDTTTRQSTNCLQPIPKFYTPRME